MSNHTKEPWYFSEELSIALEGTQKVKWQIYRMKGVYGHPATAYSSSDAKRIVACVNFCSGIPASILEKAGPSALKELVDAVNGLLYCCDCEDELEAMRAQLIRALSKFKEVV